jgi:hypothetical protein
VAQLKQGMNDFRFTAGPQACYSFDWGFYWVYAFTVRLYYGGSMPHPEGRITSPADGDLIGDFPRIVATAHRADVPISRVDFLGEYEDFNWEGDGVFRQWHYVLERGILSRHIGTAMQPPWTAAWDTSWLPDQQQPVRLAARITDAHGWSYMTPAVTVRMQRAGRSVKMFKASDVPEKFASRVGARKECKIMVEGSLAGARAMRLLLSTWSAAHDGEITLNKTKLADRVGYVHNYSFDSIPLARGVVKEGENVFSIFSNTKEHAAEVNWPGPVLLVEYGPPDPKPGTGKEWLESGGASRLTIEAAAGAWARQDAPVEVRLDLHEIAGEPGSVSLQVVEISREGRLTDANVPFQFDQQQPGSGVLVLMMKGRTPAGTSRRFHLYAKTGSARNTSPQTVTVIDDVDCEGQKSYRVATPAGTYFYHKEGAGFASLKDPDGAEWIGYHPGGRSAGEFRGIPNLGEFGHPGYTGENGSKSRLLSAGPLKAIIHSERHDGKWAVQWEIYPSHARMTMLKNEKPYWFLYEGTPEGKLDLDRGHLVLSSGEVKPLAELWARDVAGPEWIYFGSPGGKRVLFLSKHTDDDAPDQYWPMDGNMTVFGFGRQYRCCGRYLTGSGEQFTFGLAPNGSFEQVRQAIEAASSEVSVRVSGWERAAGGAAGL